jgi:unsaturated rhamnogalacturonyl hydrolase
MRYIYLKSVTVLLLRHQWKNSIFKNRYSLNESIIKGILVATILGVLTIGTASGQTRLRPIVEIKNSTAINRDTELVAIPYKSVQSKLPQGGRVPFKLINIGSDVEVPYQIEYRGNVEPLNILVQVNCPANGSLLLAVQVGKPAFVQPKTYARFVPQRFDDFAWENDRIAHRIYGPALAKRPDNAYGIDVWSKSTTALILDKWYKLMDFDTDHGEGLDFYGVGKSLGAGDIALYIRDTLYFTNNYSTWKILDNGPLRSTFQLTYAAKKASDITYTVTKTISIDAGSQLSRIEVIFNCDHVTELPVAIGIVKRAKPGKTLFDDKDAVMGYWEPENPVHGTTGLGCVFINPIKKMGVEKGHLLTTAIAKSSRPFVYYTGAAWSRSAFIKNDQQWFNYLTGFSEQIKHPLEVKVIK